MNTQALIRELREIYISKYPECEEKIGYGSSLAQIESAITKIRPIPKALIDIYSCVGGENSDLDYCHDFPVAWYHLVSLDRIDGTIDLDEELRQWEWDELFKDLIDIDWDLAKEIASQIDPEIEDYDHP